MTRLTRKERVRQLTLPVSLEYQPEPTFCDEQPAWERREIMRHWLETSGHKKARSYRAWRAVMRAEYARYTPEVLAVIRQRHEEEQRKRDVDAGLVFDCPPEDAVAFWYDSRFGLKRARDLRLGRWINRVQLDGLLRRGMPMEYIVHKGDCRWLR